jgi:hypothetical protein
MKKIFIVFVSMVSILLISHSTCIAQDNPLPQTRRAPNINNQEFTEMESSKTLHFKNESKQAEVNIQVSEEYNFLLIEIQGTFQEGETLIELFDPNGNKKGFFTIKTETNITKGKNTSVMEMVSGKLAKHYRDPLKGDWLIRISPKMAVGYININTSLIYNPGVNVPETDHKNDDRK